MLNGQGMNFVAFTNLDEILAFLERFGLGQGILLIVVLGVLYFLYNRFEKMFDQALEGKQKEIDRLAEENKNYREMFMNLLKDKLEIESLKDKSPSSDRESNLDLNTNPQKIKNKKQ